PPVIALLVGAAAVMPWYLSNVHPMLWPDPYNRSEQAAVDGLHELPAGSLALSDEPGFLWRADRLTVPYFDDSSVKRIQQGQITRLNDTISARTFSTISTTRTLVRASFPRPRTTPRPSTAPMTLAPVSPSMRRSLRSSGSSARAAPMTGAMATPIASVPSATASGM